MNIFVHLCTVILNVFYPSNLTIMPRIQCTTTHNGLELTLYGTCPQLNLGDHTPCSLDTVYVGNVAVPADELTPENYDTLCEVLSLNAELQH